MFTELATVGEQYRHFLRQSLTISSSSTDASGLASITMLFNTFRANLSMAFQAGLKPFIENIPRASIYLLHARLTC